jgi:hypothetical protein
MVVRTVGPAVAAFMVVAVTACGGGAAAGGPRGMDEQTRQQVEQCLQAAGIAVPTPGPRPTDRPTERPTDRPRPTGAPGGGMFGDPKVQAALKACGITLPSRTAAPPA